MSEPQHRGRGGFPVTDMASLLQRARLGLLVLGVSLALGLALVLVSCARAQAAWDELARARSELVAQQQRLRQVQAELAELQTHRERFLRLARSGLLRMADRQGWVEQLGAAHQRARLPGALHYTLQAPLAPSPGVVVHDLEVGLEGVHEQELLALLQDFKAHVGGRLRVNACQLSEPTAQGLKAQCVLRFFTLPVSWPTVDAPAAPTPPMAGPDPGTLLYARGERLAIVAARSANAAAPSSVVQLSGIVKRERGNSTAWINRQPVAEGDARQPTISIQSLTLEQQRLRVGETLDLRSGERRDIVNPADLTVGERP